MLLHSPFAIFASKTDNMSEEKEIYKHSIPVQLRFNDTDALGHVNNSVYLSFYDLGKSDYFNTIRGLEIKQRDVDVVIAHIDVDFIAPVFLNFIAPVFLNDHIAVQTRVSAIGNKSFSLKQRIVDQETGEEKCVCHTVMVGFDFETNTTKPISKEWREAIELYEGHSY